MNKPQNGIEQWDAVHALLKQGKRIADVSREMGISYAHAYQAAKKQRPKFARRLNHIVTDEDRIYTCVSCGTTKRKSTTIPSYRFNATNTCKPCLDDQKEQARMAKVSVLVQHYRKTGSFPTASEAAEILGMSRSRCGDFIKLARESGMITPEQWQAHLERGTAKTRAGSRKHNNEVRRKRPAAMR